MAACRRRHKLARRIWRNPLPLRCRPKRYAARIVVLRGRRVMLDADLAELYGVATKVLVQAVKRNLERLPSDFMLPLENHDLADLRSQSVTAKTGGGGRRTATFVFTEQGVAMLASVLKSPQAVQVKIGIVRTFVRLRETLARKVDSHDEAIVGLLRALRELMAPPAPACKRPIGFIWPDDPAATA
jgi:phage regulator Rha-like protein